MVNPADFDGEKAPLIHSDDTASPRFESIIPDGYKQAVRGPLKVYDKRYDARTKLWVDITHSHPSIGKKINTVGLVARPIKTNTSVPTKRKRTYNFAIEIRNYHKGFVTWVLTRDTKMLGAMTIPLGEFKGILAKMNHKAKLPDDTTQLQNFICRFTSQVEIDRAQS